MSEAFLFGNARGSIDWAKLVVEGGAGTFSNSYGHTAYYSPQDLSRDYLIVGVSEGSQNTPGHRIGRLKDGVYAELINGSTDHNNDFEITYDPSYQRLTVRTASNYSSAKMLVMYYKP